MQSLVSSIQQLSSTEVEEVFRILQKHNCKYTSNKNGIFLNMSWLSQEAIKDIDNFIHYCNDSRNELERFEEKQRQYGDMRIEAKSLSVIHPSSPSSSHPGPQRDTKNRNRNIKFQLLKKKFQKPAPLPSGSKSELDIEVYEELPGQFSIEG